MKNVLFKIAVIGILPFTVFSCKKSSSTPSTPSTNTNTNTSNATFSATINGTAMTFTGTATYTSSAGWLTIKGSNSSYVIQIINLVPAVNSPVTLASYQNFSSYGTITAAGGSEVWQTDANNTGTMNLTVYNTTSNTTSGTFSFKGNEVSPTSGASTISVTSGSFANLTW
jgi:hypothetical protein